MCMLKSMDLGFIITIGIIAIVSVTLSRIIAAARSDAKTAKLLATMGHEISDVDEFNRVTEDSYSAIADYFNRPVIPGMVKRRGEVSLNTAYVINDGEYLFTVWVRELPKNNRRVWRYVVKLRNGNVIWAVPEFEFVKTNGNIIPGGTVI